MARMQALSPGRRRCCPSAEVWGVCEKTPLPRGTCRRTGADVVARTQTLSPGRRRRRLSVEVWGVCEKTPLPHGTRHHTGADVVPRTHAFLPGHMRCRLGVDVVIQAGTLSPGRRWLWSPDDAYARPQALSPTPVPSAPEPHRV